MSSPIGVLTYTSTKEKDTFLDARKQLRSNVRATNVTLDYFTDTPWGSSSLMFVYARLSLPCCGKKTPTTTKLSAGISQSEGRKCMWSCDEHLHPKICPPSGTSLGRLPKGEDTSREICLICTNGSLLVNVCLSLWGYLFSQWLHNTIVNLPVCASVNLIF